VKKSHAIMVRGLAFRTPARSALIVEAWARYHGGTDGPHARRREPHAHGGELAVDAPVAPARVFPRKSETKLTVPARHVPTIPGAPWVVVQRRSHADHGANRAASRASRRAAFAERPRETAQAR